MNKVNTIAIGSLVWLLVGLLALAGLIELQLVEQVFLLAPLVIVPLGLGLVGVSDRVGYQRRLYKLIQSGQPVCALAVVVSFLLPAGLPAGALALCWLALTGLVALLGISRFISRGYFDVRETVIDVGLVYLAVGGGWLALSRLGMNPLGFDDLIVLLTAVHFHYAGFAAPLITGLTGLALGSAAVKVRALSQVSAFGVIIGTPLVAAGITLSPLLELVGAIILATSLAGVGYLTGLIVLRTAISRPTQIVLTVSAICLIIGLVLIYIYAVGEFSGYHLVSIPLMVRAHGVVNALGFALCGLLGWRMLQTELNGSRLSV